MTSCYTFLRFLSSYDLSPLYSLRYLSFKMSGVGGKWWCGLEVPNESIPIYNTKLTNQNQLLFPRYLSVTHPAKFQQTCFRCPWPIPRGNGPVMLWAPHWWSDGTVVSAHSVLMWEGLVMWVHDNYPMNIIKVQSFIRLLLLSGLIMNLLNRCFIIDSIFLPHKN